MSDLPRTDWEQLHRWEWFRRAQWRNSFRALRLGPAGGPCRAVAELARLVKADVLLDASCGLGLRTLSLAALGANMLGCDPCAKAVECARELAREEGAGIPFFVSDWRDLPQRAPHRFHGIFCESLADVPAWDDLGASLVGFSHALRPGGFLVFPGAAPDAPADEGKRRLAALWEKEPRERIDWFWREGGTTCARLVQRRRAADYLDEAILHVIDENGTPRLETTVIRRPFYWTWKHWQEITRATGFCHLEARSWDGLAPDGGRLTLLVAWKAQEGEPRVDEAGRNAPYAE